MSEQNKQTERLKEIAKTTKDESLKQAIKEKLTSKEVKK